MLCTYMSLLELKYLGFLFKIFITNCNFVDKLTYFLIAAFIRLENYNLIEYFFPFLQKMEISTTTKKKRNVEQCLFLLWYIIS